MAAPLKPWEKVGVNRQSEERPPETFMSSGPRSFELGSATPGALPSLVGADNPPPVPARPSSVGYSGYGNSYSGYGVYSSPYSFGGGNMYSSPYNSSMYGGGYGSSMYGGYGLGYNRMGYGQGQEYNSFARLAEESSRPAFQSIESIVQAFSSVSMMLDSTFQAVFNSFRAVVGVADNFSRMKLQFTQIFAAFSVFRMLKYLYRKLLVILRLRPQGFAEEAWEAAGDIGQSATASGQAGGKKSSWPVLMFFAIIMGGPWLIWKFLQKAFSNQGTAEGWANGSEDHFVAQALYDFTANSNEEISFKAGSNLNIAPKEVQPRLKGWLLASVDSGKSVGIVPANYVKVLGKRRGTKVTNYPLQNDLQSLTELSSTNTLPHSQSLGNVNIGTNRDSMNNQGLIQSQSASNLDTQTRLDFNDYLPAGNSQLQNTSNPTEPSLNPTTINSYKGNDK